MRSPARTVRGGKITLPYSSFVPASSGIVCKACIVGYSSFKISSVEADMKSYTAAIRASTGTSRGPPRIAALLLAAKIHNGSNFMLSGKMSLLNALDACVLSNLNSRNVATTLVITASRASCNRTVSVRSAPKRAMNAPMAPQSTARYISAMSVTTGTAIVCTRILRSPSAEVYSSAHCKYEMFVLGTTSSCAMCTPYALSPSVAGSASKSIDRMKKCPLKAQILNPRLHRTRHTASHAVKRVRLFFSSFAYFTPSLSGVKPG
mmetsp:Transcript_4819/g.18482  ORF Transcript_4819/g.18482 Transcript_4819/m.18482 type:complete len:263 (+) Transcript_4819:438-1226(+)